VRGRGGVVREVRWKGGICLLGTTRIIATSQDQKGVCKPISVSLAVIGSLWFWFVAPMEAWSPEKGS
jgi:hypothetical protein